MFIIQYFFLQGILNILCGVFFINIFVTYFQVVLKELVLLKQDQCPVCLELRASAIQSFFGFALPLVLAPVTSIGVSINLHAVCISLCII